MANEKIENSLVDEKTAKDLLNEAVDCTTEITVGEVTKLLVGFFKVLPNFNMFQSFISSLDENQKLDFDEFLDNLEMSIVATFMENYNDRDKVGKA